jgi:hypothetical protein
MAAPSANAADMHLDFTDIIVYLLRNLRYLLPVLGEKDNGVTIGEQ